MFYMYLPVFNESIDIVICAEVHHLFMTHIVDVRFPIYFTFIF